MNGKQLLIANVLALIALGVVLFVPDPKTDDLEISPPGHLSPGSQTTILGPHEAPAIENTRPYP